MNIIDYFFPRRKYKPPMKNKMSEEEKDRRMQILEHPSSDIVLDEIRIMYQLEEGRRQSIINKTGILLAIISIYIGILIYSFIFSKNIFFLLIIITLGISFLYSLSVIRVEKYSLPHKKISEYMGYAKKDRNILNKRFIIEYIEATEYCTATNDVLLQRFKLSIIFLLISGLFFLLFTLSNLL